MRVGGHDKRQRHDIVSASCAAGQALERLLRELFNAKLLHQRDDIPSLFMKAYCTSFAMCVSSREDAVREILVRVLKEEVASRCALSREALRVWRVHPEASAVGEVFLCLREEVGEDAARVILHFACLDEETVFSAVTTVCNVCLYVKRFYLTHNAPWGMELLNLCLKDPFSTPDLSDFRFRRDKAVR